MTAAPPVAAAPNVAPVARLRAELEALEATARDRLKGTRALALIDRLPAAIERALDAALAKVGLMRSTKAPGSAAVVVVAREVETVLAEEGAPAVVEPAVAAGT